MSQIVCRLLTLTYKLNKIEKKFFFTNFLNKKLEESFLRNFHLKSQISLGRPNIFDALYALGFEELQNFSKSSIL